MSLYDEWLNNCGTEEDYDAMTEPPRDQMIRELGDYLSRDEIVDVICDEESIDRTLDRLDEEDDEPNADLMEVEIDVDHALGLIDDIEGFERHLTLFEVRTRELLAWRDMLRVRVPALADEIDRRVVEVLSESQAVIQEWFDFAKAQGE